MIKRFPAMLSICLVVVVLAPSLAWAQDQDQEGDVAEQDQKSEETEATEDESEKPAEESFFETTTVTATAQPTDTFSLATPVAVISAETIEQKMPDNPVDLFREQPGVDVNGVGQNQPRPIIRGQRGLRVLFMENGLRMNNARRQTDFGEVSGLVDLDSVQTMEVVRGPASVLYGTDAIGGVLNLVTKTPAYRDGSWMGFDLGLRYGTAAELKRGNAFFQGRQDRFSFNLGYTYREAEDYDAPSGSYGDVTFDEDTPVNDTGIKDDTVFGYLGYDVSDTQQLFLRFNRYRANETGFGWVDPLLLGELDKVQILYPYQDFDRATLGYRSSAYDNILMNTVNVNLMYQKNERELQNLIDAYTPFGGPTYFHVAINSLNYTELDTLGLRGEFTKVINDNHLLTYGGEYYGDDSTNTDELLTEGFIAFQFDPTAPPVDSGPPVFSQYDDVPNTPNADNTNYGVFIQDQFLFGTRFSGTVGLRYSAGDTKAKPTPGIPDRALDFDDSQTVGAINLVYRATENLHLIGTYGTAFRMPNIVERLFSGLTPEGSGYQILNENLESETSDNFDLGLKYQRSNAMFELIYFRNEIDNGIVQYFLSDEEIDQLPDDIKETLEMLGVNFVVQQRNLDQIRYEGVEALIGYRFDNGVSLGANYTYFDPTFLDADNPPTGDTYSDKINFHVRYDQLKGRWWAEYRFRMNGEADAVSDPNQPLPAVGAILPSFQIHTLAGGVTLFPDASIRHSFGITVDNFTNELYAEASNSSFFRPQPKLNVGLSYRMKM
jgi:hemoglobin/transferrin/lactoferrin receptor protein